MNKPTRKARAAAARPGTIAADKRINIRPEPEPACLTNDDAKKREWGYVNPSDFFSEDDLATMPLVVRNTTRKTRRVLVWRSEDGTWYRRGGHLHIRQRGGRRVFEIVLFKGANERDYNVLRREVDRVRTGMSADHWMQIDADWADEHTFGYAFHNYHYCDPWSHRDSTKRVSACDESRCIAKVHAEGDWHEIDSIDKVSRNGEVKYRISVQKDPDDNSPRGWRVDVYTDEFYGSPEDVASFVVDLEWARQEAQRANERDQQRDPACVEDAAA